MPCVVDSVAPWRGYICLENRRSRFKSQPDQQKGKNNNNKNKSNNNKQTNNDSNGTIEKSKIACLEK